MSIKCDSNSNEGTRHLERLGWDSHFQAQMEKFFPYGPAPARVVGVSKSSFRVSDGKNERLATLAGRLQHDPCGRFPVAGDWVVMKDAVISGVLDRRNALSRGAAGARGKQEEQPQREQVIAANLDTVFIVSGLDRDFNPRRLERYLTLIYNCGLDPVIVLTKADLHRDPERFVGQAEAVAFGVPIHLASALDDKGLIPLESYLSPGRTTAMLGSSGAGKSTLVNRLCGESVQPTATVSARLGKGRHTTTSRDLIVTPQGGMLIDNPGIREIAFWESGDGVGAAFPDIERLGALCRFTDCSHTHEPGCRVLRAVAENEISLDRLENYRKMKRELDYMAQRRHKSADRVEKERWKQVALKIRSMKQDKR